MSKLKELKENVKEKGKQVGDWIEDNFGKACLIGLGTFEIAMLAYVKHSGDKHDSEMEKNDRIWKEKNNEAYQKFLEGILQKTFEEKGFRTR